MTMRRRRLSIAIAIAVPLAVIALGVASWMDAGVQPVENQTIAVPLPELAR